MKKSELINLIKHHIFLLEEIKRLYPSVAEAITTINDIPMETLKEYCYENEMTMHMPNKKGMAGVNVYSEIKNFSVRLNSKALEAVYQEQ